jgi:putative ATPase
LTLHQLTEEEILTLINRAINDKERGLATLQPQVEEDTLDRLARLSSGDARVALTALEIATNAAAPDAETAARRVTTEMIVEAMGRANFAYDKGGEDHYNLASALIKSLRNSDADAGLYWLARLIEGGADPMFIARRLSILASEDIGLADPQAMQQAAAAAQITHLIGLPEALYPLSQTVVYLARAPKSNAIKRAYFAAAADAQETAREPVPLHLRNAITNLMKAQGYGVGYRYVHSDQAAKDEMECLPEALRGHKYWKENDERGTMNDN